MIIENFGVTVSKIDRRKSEEERLAQKKREKWKEKSENFAVGDMVKICDDGMRRGETGR
jgi:transcription antitermination factor NusG